MLLQRRVIASADVPCILQSVNGMRCAGAAVEARGMGDAAAEDYRRHTVQVLQAGGVRIAGLRDGPLTGY